MGGWSRECFPSLDKAIISLFSPLVQLLKGALPVEVALRTHSLGAENACLGRKGIVTSRQGGFPLSRTQTPCFLHKPGTPCFPLFPAARCLCMEPALVSGLGHWDLYKAGGLVPLLGAPCNSLWNLPGRGPSTTGSIKNSISHGLRRAALPLSPQCSPHRGSTFFLWDSPMELLSHTLETPSCHPCRRKRF